MHHDEGAWKLICVRLNPPSPLPPPSYIQSALYSGCNSCVACLDGLPTPPPPPPGAAPGLVLDQLVLLWHLDQDLLVLHEHFQFDEHLQLSTLACLSHLHM